MVEEAKSKHRVRRYFMIKSKKDYLYFWEADRIALCEKRKSPNFISIYESDVI